MSTPITNEAKSNPIEATNAGVEADAASMTGNGYRACKRGHSAVPFLPRGMKRTFGKVKRLGFKVTRPIRQGLFPKATNLNSGQGRAFLAPHAPRPVFILAHPDDEFFCSGLICFLRETFQSEISIITVTDGGGGSSQLQNADEALHTIRLREMQRACESLGVENFRCLGFEDPREDFVSFHSPARDVAKGIGEACAEIGPTLAITHGINGEYWHPAHTVTRRAVRTALPQIPLLTMCAYDPDHPYPHVTNLDDPAHYRLEVDGYFEKTTGRTPGARQPVMGV